MFCTHLANGWLKLDAEVVVPVRHVTITEHMHMSRDDGEGFRRIEVFTGAGRRRSWSRDDKVSTPERFYSGWPE